MTVILAYVGLWYN